MAKVVVSGKKHSLMKLLARAVCGCWGKGWCRNCIVGSEGGEEGGGKRWEGGGRRGEGRRALLENKARRRKKVG